MPAYLSCRSIRIQKLKKFKQEEKKNRRRFRTIEYLIREYVWEQEDLLYFVIIIGTSSTLSQQRDQDKIIMKDDNTKQQPRKSEEGIINIFFTLPLLQLEIKFIFLWKSKKQDQNLDKIFLTQPLLKDNLQKRGEWVLL